MGNDTKWFSAVSSNDLEGIEKMLEEGFDANTRDAKGETALQKVAKKLYVSIFDLDWDREKLLKEIAATLVIHGANQEDLGHRGGESCDIARAITKHIIKTAALKGKLGPIHKLIENEDIWFSHKDESVKERFFGVLRHKDIVSIEKMFEYELIGFPPTQ